MNIGNLSGTTVRCFGDFELTLNGCPVGFWQAGKARNLLQLLLVQRGKILSKEILYESLWPEVPLTNHSSSLKVAVHTLRRILSAYDSGVAFNLVTHQNGYALEIRDAWIDFEIFCRLVDQARAVDHNGDRIRALELFRNAEKLYAGHFLPDVELEWAALHREWLRSRVLHVMERLVDADLASGDHLGVIDRCRRMLEIEPCREETYRAVILAHGRLGQLSQVHRWYQLCVARLHDELQMKPSPTTERLYQQARRGGLVATASCPRSV